VNGNSYVGGIAYHVDNIISSVFDVQGTGRQSGNTAMHKSTGDLTQGAPIPGLYGSWTYIPMGHYPRPTALASNINPRISDASALGAVALRMYMGSDLYTTADTSARVTRPFTVPVTTASGKPIVWSVEPAGALTVDTSGNVTLNGSGEVKLTATEREYIKVFKLKLEPALFAVTFETQGGTTVPSVPNLPYGSKVARPLDPSKAGYAFAGWFEDTLDPATEWNFDEDTVTKDITLYVKWTPIASTYYTVTFDSRGGSAVHWITNVAPGSTISKPSDPTFAGYSFVGWYKEPSGLTAWNFATDTVKGNITLYAIYQGRNDDDDEGDGGGGGGGCDTGVFGLMVLAFAALSVAGRTKKRN
jgi:uncharacterized repeat protein (TIGR02543 family)